MSRPTNGFMGPYPGRQYRDAYGGGEVCQLTLTSRCVSTALRGLSLWEMCAFLIKKAASIHNWDINRPSGSD